MVLLDSHISYQEKLFSYDKSHENSLPAQLDLFPSNKDIEDTVKQGSQCVEKLLSSNDTNKPVLQAVPVQEELLLNEDDFKASLKQYKNLFSDVEIENIEYDKDEQIIKFVTQSMECVLSFQKNKKPKYTISGVDFKMSDLGHNGPKFGILLMKIGNYLGLQISDIHPTSNNYTKNKNKKTLPEPNDTIFLAKTTEGEQNVHYLKYNGNIEKNNASIHIKIGSEVYRVSQIDYTIIEKDPREVESETQISINNPTALYMKKFNPYQGWEEVKDAKLYAGLRDLSCFVLLNYNPHIKS